MAHPNHDDESEFLQKKSLEPTSQRPTHPVPLFVWFGLCAGWLELMLVLAMRVLDPRISKEMLRTNQHHFWMNPLANFLLFGGVGLVVFTLSSLRLRLSAGWQFRILVSLTCLALLLRVEGLYESACLVLAGGLGSVFGPWLARREPRLRTLIQRTNLVMGAGLLALIAVGSTLVLTAEQRALVRHPKAAPGTPNVLLVVMDNVRAASLSLYGHQRETTPNLSWYAQQGLVFTEARAPAPWTLPTHASLFTGRWPFELSVSAEHALDREFPTLAEVLAEKGFATAGFVGNTFYCNALYGLNRGFDRYDDAYENQLISFFEVFWNSSLGRKLIHLLGYPTRVADGETWVRKSAEMINQDALAWLSERPKQQPFFLFLNYYDAHAPFLPPDGPTPRFGLASLPLAQRHEIDQSYLDWSEGKPNAQGLGPERIVNDAIDLYRDSYESCIASLDFHLGQLLGELERQGTLENTLVIITSDHGEHFGEHGLQGHGLSLYRREVHVPLVIIPPSRKRAEPRVVTEPVSLRSLPSTVADFLDLDRNHPFPSRSLARFLHQPTDPESALPSTVLSEVEQIKTLGTNDLIPSARGPLRSLISPTHVYIRQADGQEELYDLQHHPEAENLAPSPAAEPTLGEFRAQLTRLAPKKSATGRRQPKRMPGKVMF